MGQAPQHNIVAGEGSGRGQARPLHHREILILFFRVVHDTLAERISGAYPEPRLQLYFVGVSS